MTKREKCAMIIFTLIGFVAVCVFCLTVIVPFCIAMSFMNSERMRFTEVDYNNLPTAMGASYVYISSDFFDGDSDLVLLDNGVAQVDYIGKTRQYGDGNNQINNSQRYRLNFYCYAACMRIEFSCAKSENKIGYPADYSYKDFNYYIKIRENCENNEEGICLRYIKLYAQVVAEDGNLCDIEVYFMAENSENRLINKAVLEEYILQCRLIFENLLDNLLNYSQIMQNYEI